MDAAEKRKLIAIISIVAFLVLGAIVVFATLPDKEKVDQLSVRVQDEGEVTVDDMIKSGNSKSQSEPGLMQTYEVPAPPKTASAGTMSKMPDEETMEDNEDVLALQRQLRENRKTRYADGYSEYGNSGRVAYAPPTKKNRTVRVEDKDVEESFSLEDEKAITKQPKPVDEPEAQQPKRRFFSSTGKKKNTDNAIAAVVHGDQTVTVGSTLKMHLQQDMTVDGAIVPKNSFVYGTVSFSGERMIVKVSSIRLSGNIYPVNLDVYDKDGIQGIYVPGNIKAEAKGDVTEAGANEITAAGTGVIGSAVRAVVSAGKSVVSKKVRTQKATVRTNYNIYLQWGKN